MRSICGPHGIARVMADQINQEPLTRREGRNVKSQVLFVASLLSLATMAASAESAGPSDAQIAAIVVTANQVDIDAGRLADMQTHSAEVKSFAQLMIRDHAGVNQAATDLVQKLHVTPEPNPTSESLQKSGEQNLAALKELSGSAFDKAYIDHEVAYHQGVIDALDQTLIPNAHNAELKALLVKVRPGFVAHLDHAKEVQAGLAKAGD